MVAEIHQNMSKAREDASSQDRTVSSTHILDITERVLTTTQIQTRSVVSTTGGSCVLHLHLAHLENPHLQHREPTSDAVN